MKTRNKLDRLTAKQEAALPGIAREWIQAAWDTSPADRATVEDGIRRCYELTVVPWHGRVVWVKSPLTAALAGAAAAECYGGDGDSPLDDRTARRLRTLIERMLSKLGPAVSKAVGDAAVDCLAGLPVRKGITGSQLRQAITSSWSRYVGGRAWSAWIAWRDTLIRFGAPVGDDIRARNDAYRDANQAGWWWPHSHFTVVADQWTTLRLERVGPDGWGSHRLHSENGPAVAWGDEWAIYAWHGVVVPSWVIDHPLDRRFLDRTLRLVNTEQRRAALERYGWDRVIVDLDLPLVGEEPDPANHPHTIRLFDLPADVSPYEEPTRLVVMVNASPGRDGHILLYAETVPGTVDTPMEAMAWRWGVTVDEYRQMERAT